MIDDADTTIKKEPTTPILYSDDDSDDELILENAIKCYKKEQELGDETSSPSYYDYDSHDPLPTDNDDDEEHYSTGEENDSSDDDDYDVQAWHNKHERLAYSIPKPHWDAEKGRYYLKDNNKKCNDCMVDTDGIARDGACPKHSEAWFAFGQFYQRRIDRYKSDAYSMPLPPIPIHVSLDIFRCWYEDIQRCDERNKQRRTYVSYLAEMREMESIKFHGPWNYMYYNLSYNPALIYNKENGYYGPWIHPTVRLYPDSRDTDPNVLRLADPQRYNSLTEQEMADLYEPRRIRYNAWVRRNTNNYGLDATEVEYMPYEQYMELQRKKVQRIIDDDGKLVYQITI